MSKWLHFVANNKKEMEKFFKPQELTMHELVGRGKHCEQWALIDLVECQKLFSLIKSILDFQFDYLYAI